MGRRKKLCTREHNEYPATQRQTRLKIANSFVLVLTCTIRVPNMIQIQNAMAQPLPSTRSPLCMLTRTGDPKTGIAWIPDLIWLLSATAMTISTTPDP